MPNDRSEDLALIHDAISQAAAVADELKTRYQNTQLENTSVPADLLLRSAASLSVMRILLTRYVEHEASVNDQIQAAIAKFDLKF